MGRHRIILTCPCANKLRSARLKSSDLTFCYLFYGSSHAFQLSKNNVAIFCKNWRNGFPDSLAFFSKVEYLCNNIGCFHILSTTFPSYLRLVRFPISRKLKEIYSPALQARLCLFVILAQASVIPHVFFRSVRNSLLFLDAGIPRFCSCALAFFCLILIVRFEALEKVWSCGLFASVRPCVQ